MKDWTILPSPELLPNKEYVMGIDTYDKNMGAICVISKNITGGNLVCEYSSRVHKEDFEEEVKRVAQYYNIPEDKILKEQD
ncbi:MAG: hypothetical protein V4547_17130 [Bacteroidota bacterium]